MIGAAVIEAIVLAAAVIGVRPIAAKELGAEAPPTGVLDFS